jgi:GNAT superfamily N-acetyltransferase
MTAARPHPPEVDGSTGAAAARIVAMTTGVIVRKATGDEMDLVTDLRLAFYCEHNRLDVDTVGGLRDATATFIATEHAAGRAVTWLAEQGETVVGLVTVLIRARPPRHTDLRTSLGYAVNMYVVPASRRRGIGAALLAACIDGCTALGLRSLTLHATEDGRHLYDSFGFEPDPRWLEVDLPHSTG